MSVGLLIKRARTPRRIAAQQREELALHIGLGIDGDGRGVHSRRDASFGVLRQTLQTTGAQSLVEPIVGTDGPCEIPGVHEHVLGQHRDDHSCVNLHWRIVPDCRNLDHTIEQARTRKHPLQRSARQIPAREDVVARPLRFGAERSQQEHVVKADDVFDDRACIPSVTRGGTAPLPRRRDNRSTKSSTCVHMGLGHGRLGHTPMQCAIAWHTSHR